MKFDSKKWEGRKFQCLKTGTIVELSEVTARQFIEIGEGFIDVGDGHYSRFGGSILELETEVLSKLNAERKSKSEKLLQMLEEESDVYKKLLDKQDSVGLNEDDINLMYQIEQNLDSRSMIQ